MISLREESGEKLSTSEIIGLCYGYGGDTMFAFVDAIMAMNIPLSIEICKRISSSSKVDEWFGGFV